jgi:hypothetical protein
MYAEPPLWKTGKPIAVHTEQKAPKVRYAGVGTLGTTMADLQQYRDAAARCLELATQTNDPNMRTELLLLAQKWRHQFASDDDRFLKAVLGAPVSVGGEMIQFMYVVADGLSQRMPWLKPHETLREANVVIRAALDYGLQRR